MNNKVIDLDSFKNHNFTQNDYENILNELDFKGVRKEFEKRLNLLGGLNDQVMFNFLYTTYKLNPTMFD